MNGYLSCRVQIAPDDTVYNLLTGSIVTSPDYRPKINSWSTGKSSACGQLGRGVESQLVDPRFFLRPLLSP